LGVPVIIIHDNGAQNHKITKVLIERHRITNISIATYHPQSNVLVERDHQQIVDGLANLGPKWVKNLPLVLWADRITTRASMGFTPYRLVFGQDCVLSIELTAASWATVNWNRIKTRAELLAAQAKQLARKEEYVREAQENIRKSRLRNKAYFDKNRLERIDQIGVGDLVLLYNSELDKQWSQKLCNKWLGPYRIRQIAQDRGTYLLEELDRTKLEGIFAGDHVKRFHPRYGVESEDEDESEDKDEEN